MHDYIQRTEDLQKPVFKVMAVATQFIPNFIIAKLAHDYLTPYIIAQVVIYMDPKAAAKIGKSLRIDYMGQVALYASPEITARIGNLMEPPIVAQVVKDLSLKNFNAKLGELADLIDRRFELACKRLGLNRDRRATSGAADNGKRRGSETAGSADCTGTGSRLYLHVSASAGELAHGRCRASDDGAPRRQPGDPVARPVGRCARGCRRLPGEARPALQQLSCPQSSETHLLAAHADEGIRPDDHVVLDRDVEEGLARAQADIGDGDVGRPEGGHRHRQGA